MKATVHAISIEGHRFVLSLKTASGLAYFSTSLEKPDAVRITQGQLKATFDELALVANPIAHLLTNRSKWVGRELEIEVVTQMKGKEPVINPKTGLPYTQVRLVPSSKDLDESVVNRIFAEAAAIAAVSAEAKGDDADLS